MSMVLIVVTANIVRILTKFCKKKKSYKTNLFHTDVSLLHKNFTYISEFVG